MLWLLTILLSAFYAHAKPGALPAAPACDPERFANVVQATRLSKYEEQQERNLEIIARYKKGDRRAFRDLLENNKGAIEYVVSRAKNWERQTKDEDEIRQQIHIRIFQSLQHYSPENGTFANFLIFTTQQRARQLHARAAAKPQHVSIEIQNKENPDETMNLLDHMVASGAIQVEDLAETIQQRLDMAKFREELKVWMKKLSPLEQKVVERVLLSPGNDVDNLAEIGKEAGVSKQRIHQVKNALVEKAGKHFRDFTNQTRVRPPEDLAVATENVAPVTVATPSPTVAMTAPAPAPVPTPAPVKQATALSKDAPLPPPPVDAKATHEYLLRIRENLKKEIPDDGKRSEFLLAQLAKVRAEISAAEPNDKLVEDILQSYILRDGPGKPISPLSIAERNGVDVPTVIITGRKILEKLDGQLRRALVETPPAGERR